VQLILLTICVFVLVNWIAANWLRRTGEGTAESTSLRHHVRAEIRAWLIIAGVLVAIALLVFIYTLIFGPIRPIHEWGT
jgi:hypothetical protein